jgi:predicted aspartyl protease
LQVNPKRIWQACAAFSILIGLTAGAFSQAWAQSEPIRTEGPLFEAFNGRLTVATKINGRGPFRFFIDTAASHSALFEKTQISLGIKPATDRQANIFTAFGTEKLQLSQPLRIDTAGRTLDDTHAVLLSDWTSGGEPDGILGLDFLARYFVLLKIGEGKIVLFDEKPPVRSRYWTSAAMEAGTLGRLGTPLYFTQIQMKGRRHIAIVDTGSISTVLNWSAALRLGITRNSPQLRTSRIRDALGIQRPVTGVRFRSLKVGGKRWRNHDVLIADLNIFDALDRKDRPTAMLGLDLLKKQNVAFDFQGQRIYLAK